MTITTVGFGAWAVGRRRLGLRLGPAGRRATRSPRSGTPSRAAINWIDTAAVYGLGHSEEVVGRALADAPAARAALRLHQVRHGLGSSRTAMASPRQDLRPAVDPARVRSVAAPAGRRAHRPLPVPLARRDRHAGGGLLGEMVRLIEEGKVRAVGVSNFGVELLERCEARPARGLAPAAVLADPPRRPPTRRFRWCAAHGTGVIVYSPLQSGILTERFSAERVARAGRGRLAPPLLRLQAAQAAPQSRAPRRAPPDRRAARCDRVRGGHRLDAGLARRDRRDRGRADAGAGGRLDRGGLARARRRATWTRSPARWPAAAPAPGPRCPASSPWGSITSPPSPATPTAISTSTPARWAFGWSS